jgi:phosphonate transport system ATP-binding protein
MESDLALEGVGVVYPGGTVGLQPATLELRPGAFTVLLGPSGAGKSTLLRCLNYLVVPTSGRIIVEGLGLLGPGAVLREHRRRTGMVFQQHHLVGRLSALRNVLTGRLGYHSTLRTLWPLPRRDREIALEALARVGLLHKALERADRLSGGEQQRLGIARALAQRPRRILADEPVASLDPVTAKRVLAQLRRICREDGITAIVSLHQVELALAYADRVIGLAGGRVVLDAQPDAVDPVALETLYANERPAFREPSVPMATQPASAFLAAQESP